MVFLLVGMTQIPMSLLWAIVALGVAGSAFFSNISWCFKMLISYKHSLDGISVFNSWTSQAIVAFTFYIMIKCKSKWENKTAVLSPDLPCGDVAEQFVPILMWFSSVSVFRDQPYLVRGNAFPIRSTLNTGARLRGLSTLSLVFGIVIQQFFLYGL